MAELYDWTDAAPDFRAAENEFTVEGDKHDALYAHLGVIRATIEQHNLSRTSSELTGELESNPLLRSDSELKLFCLIVKGDIDQEIDTRAARIDWEQVHAIAEKLGDKRWQNRALGQIGITAFYDRDLTTARKDVARAVETATRLHDVGAQIRFTTVLGMALLEAKMYDRALPYLEKALLIAKMVPDAGYPFFTNEARVQALVGLHQYGDAQRLVTEMLKQARSTDKTGTQAEILSLAAQIALARGDIRGAIADLQECVTIWSSKGYEQVVAEPEGMLAAIFRQQGNLPQAEYYATRAAASSQSSGDKWSLPKHLQTLAELQVARGEYVAADRTYDRASAFIDSGLAKSSSILEKTALIKASGNLYPEHFALLVSRLKDPEKAYSIVEQVRGRVATDLLMSGSVNSAKAKHIERTISGLQLQMMSAKSAADVNRLRDQIFAAEEQHWISPGISILKRRALETVAVHTVQQSLDSATAILEYVIADPQSYCLIISRTSFHIVPLAGKSRIDPLVNTYLKAIRDRGRADAEANELYRLLLRPISEIGRARNLVVVRDGELDLLPFDALETSSGTYVIESHTITYAPSVTAFYLLSREIAQTGGPNGPLLGVGGIPYSKSLLHSINFGQNEPSTHLGDLEYAKKEVLDASAAIKGHNTLLIGAGATESAFKRAADHRYGTVHLAVHGFAESPDSDQSGLALLPDPDAGEDGVLRASEIVMLHLNANLVVLSACDTAVGPIQGEEGIATLANSFLLAGAKAVVSTLWSADDSSSLFLMDAFYSRIAAGNNPAVALAEAKRKMLQRFGKAALPYYWAGFIVEGALESSARR